MKKERLKYPVENMIGYLKTMGHLTLEDRRFCEADALVLSQLSYMQFSGFVPGLEEGASSVALLDFYDSFDKDEYFQDIHHAKRNREFYQALLESDRFRQIRASYYVNEVGKEEESQFCAVTFFLENGMVYIAFRGTDDSIIGWKEDFNMAFLSPIPSQEKARKYLNLVGEKIQGSLMVGGHSKGGNLAIYSAMRCEASVRRRIIAIFSHDGPGFRQETFKTEEYDRIRKRIHKIVPRGSLVGLLLEGQEDYRIIAAYPVGLLQHDPYSWVIRNGKFLYEKDLTPKRKEQNKRVNAWISSLDEEERKTFVENLFAVLQAPKKDTITEWTEDFKNSVLAAMTCIKEMDEDQRELMGNMMKRLVQMKKDKNDFDTEKE